LFKLVEGNPARFLEKWVNNDSRETEVLLEKAISTNSVRKNLNIYKYGSEIIGRSKEEAMAFLTNPTNQDIKRTILIELEAKSDETAVKKNTKTHIQEILEDEDYTPVNLDEVTTEVETKVKTKKKSL
jgi:hypothetical protein